jgi:hypothetical protein
LVRKKRAVERGEALAAALRRAQQWERRWAEEKWVNASAC